MSEPEALCLCLSAPVALPVCGEAWAWVPLGVGCCVCSDCGVVRSDAASSVVSHGPRCWPGSDVVWRGPPLGLGAGQPGEGAAAPP